MSAKEKGNKREHRSMKIFEKAGYRCTRAAGSLGTWDFIGVSSNDIVLCQVKSRDWPGTIEMAELREFPAPSNTRKIVHRWRDYAKEPDVKEI